jgi:hypothetical protein
MYISEHYLEEMFDMKSAKGFYKYYPKKEFQKNFEGIKKLYNDGKYRLLAKQLGILFEPTLNYLAGYNKPRTPLLNSLVKKETSDEVLAHLAVAFILNAYTEDTLFVHGDTQVVENLNYLEFHELDDRENVWAYYEFVELPCSLVQREEWIERLWQWADTHNIPSSQLPRDKDALIALTELSLFPQDIITPMTDVNELIEMAESEEEELPFSLPPELFELTQLEKLEVSLMGLTHLPEEIEKLQNLTELRLPFNQLETIPSAVGKLEQLTALELKMNQLKEIPVTLVWLDKLTHLDIIDNPLILTRSQAAWLEEIAENGCEVLWDKDRCTILDDDDEEDDEDDVRNFIESMGGEEAFLDAMKKL